MTESPKTLRNVKTKLTKVHGVEPLNIWSLGTMERNDGRLRHDEKFGKKKGG